MKKNSIFENTNNISDYDKGYQAAIDAWRAGEGNDMSNNQSANSNQQQGGLTKPPINPNKPIKSAQQQGQQGQQGQGQQGQGQGQGQQGQGQGQGQQGQGQGQGQQGQQGQGQQGQGQGDGLNDPNATVDGSKIKTPGVSTKRFGGHDVLSHEEAQKIAERAGQPYGEDDKKANPIRKAGDFIKEHRKELDSVGSNSSDHTPGSGYSLADRLKEIDQLFKPIINWKKQLKSFFYGVARKGKEYKFLKNRIASKNPVVRTSRYAKYDERKFDIVDGIAQVFFLIDNSGSMYSAASGDVFQLIWSEIIGLLKATNVKSSAATYFSDGPINTNNIRMWNENTNTKQILKMLMQSKDLTGGTNIVGSCEEVYNLQKPYFSKSDPRTLLIVVTDGGDNLKSAANIPFKVRKNMIWLMFEQDMNFLKSQMEVLIKCGFQEKNIILVDTTKL